MNGDGESKSNALRSQSVTGKHDTGVTKHDSGVERGNQQVLGKSALPVTNGNNILHNQKEVLKQSEVDSSEQITTKPVQRGSSFNTSRRKETDKLSEEVTKNLKNLRESIYQNKSAHDSGLVTRNTSQVSNATDINGLDGRLRHSESDRIRRNSGNTDKSNTVSNGKRDNSHRTLKTSSSNETEKGYSQNKTSELISESKKPVSILKETVTKLENQKKNRILEKCEIFEKADNKESVTKVQPEIHKEEIRNDKTKSKNQHILVSRADVERNKQNRLVNLRRNRSNSEPHIKSPNSFKKSQEDKGDITDNTVECDSDNKSVKNSDRFKVVEEIVDGDTELDVKIGNKVNQSNKHLNATHDNDNRLSPSLLWLEEKRKSLPLSKDIDKLMSTMDIEAAFSEILGAVEEFPDQNDVTEVQATDVPILEEENCDSSEKEEDSKGSSSNDINGKNEVDVNTETNCNEISEKIEKVENNFDSEASSAIQETSGIKKSQGKMNLDARRHLAFEADVQLLKICFCYKLYEFYAE